MRAWRTKGIQMDENFAWRPTRHQVGIVSWYTGYCIKPIKRGGSDARLRAMVINLPLTPTYITLPWWGSKPRTSRFSIETHLPRAKWGLYLGYTSICKLDIVLNALWVVMSLWYLPQWYLWISIQVNSWMIKIWMESMAIMETKLGIFCILIFFGMKHFSRNIEIWMKNHLISDSNYNVVNL